MSTVRTILGTVESGRRQRFEPTATNPQTDVQKAIEQVGQPGTKTTPGYGFLGDGQLIQRFTAAVGTSPTTLTFPKAFTTGCVPVIVASPITTQTTVAIGASPTNTQCQISAGSACNVSIIAFGW